MQGDVPTGRKKGLSQSCGSRRERAAWHGLGAAAGTLCAGGQPAPTQAPNSGLTRPGVESAALVDCGAHRDPREHTRGSGSLQVPIPEPQNGDDFVASRIRTLY